ncbi:MAG: hypothetical protein ACRDSJ_25350 [Rubrobacteraceae bacterium]
MSWKGGGWRGVRRRLFRGHFPVVFGAFVIGCFASYLSVWGSVRYVGGLWSTCPDGIVAGSPFAFVGYDGSGADAYDPPSSLSRLIELGYTRTEFCFWGYIFNSVYWSIPALPILYLLRVIFLGVGREAAGVAPSYNDRECGGRA